MQSSPIRPPRLRPTPALPAALAAALLGLAAALLGLAAALLGLAAGAGRAAFAAAPPPETTVLATAQAAPIALSGDVAAVLTRSGIEIFEQRGGTWPRQAVIPPPADMTGGSFGESMVLSGGRLAVGTARSVYVFASTSRGWVREARIDAPVDAAHPGGDFGHTLALDHDVMVVGAPNFVAAHAGGVAYVYRRAGSGWNLEATFGNAASLPTYGEAVAVAGNFAFVSGSLLGYVDVYQHPQHRWRRYETVYAVSRTGLGFGAALAASRSTVVIGGDERNVYVLSLDRGEWNVQAHLISPQPGTEFGVVVAIDGDTVVVGDPLAGSGDEHAGAAYVYTRNPHGWRLAASPRPAGATLGFGFRVAVSGHTALISGDDGAEIETVWVVEGVPLPLRRSPAPASSRLEPRD